MILSRNVLKRVGESRHPSGTPSVVQNQSPILLLKRAALVMTSLVIEVFDDSEKDCVDALLHGCPQMPNPVEGLEVYEDMLEVFLVLLLKVFLTQDL